MYLILRVKSSAGTHRNVKAILEAHRSVFGHP
jgi:hypothetical protein